MVTVEGFAGPLALALRHHPNAAVFIYLTEKENSFFSKGVGLQTNRKGKLLVFDLPYFEQATN